MTNYMAEVAKIFGVKLGESFKITSGIQGDYQKYYRFTEDNCLEISNDGVEMKSWQIFFIDDRRSLNGGICNICAHDCYCMYDEKLKCDNGIATWLKQEYTGVSDYD